MEVPWGASRQNDLRDTIPQDRNLPKDGFFLLYYTDMQKGLFAKIVVAFLLLPSIFGGLLLVANAQAVCPENEVPSGLTENELNAVLLACEKEEDALQKKLVTTGKEKATYNSEIDNLKAKIEQAKRAIRVRTLSIIGLVDDIKVKSSTITKLSAKMDRQRDSLAQLIRKTDEIDSYSFAEVALSDKKISEFFGDLDSFEYIGEAIGVSLVEIDVTKKTTEEQKGILEDKKTKESDLRYKQELEKKRTEANEDETQRLLKVTKGKEAAFQKDLKEKIKKAAQIRAALFALLDSSEIPFGKALDYANLVNQKTGIRPAFLLAIFQQESGFGKSQGSCYLKDTITGGGVGKKGAIFENVMKPGRDIKPFLDIMSRLGRDAFITPVSCPQKAGYGGAMGAAQFIPSTWVLYEDKIANAVSEKVADPWRAQDAFIAAGYLLKDNGASKGTYTTERNAACMYFSGKTCSKSSWAATYGDQVMKRAVTIQTKMIDPLSV